MFKEPTPAEIQTITAALADGNKIEAIELYRRASGKDVAESKVFIDALIPHLLHQEPEKYPVRLLAPLAIGIVVKGFGYLATLIIFGKLYRWLFG